MSTDRFIGSTQERRLRQLAGGLTAVDVALLGVLWWRPHLTAPFIRPSDSDLSAWSRGVIATYVLAQGAIAARPTPDGAQRLAMLRSVLIGGDLLLLVRGRTVDRRWGALTAIGNGALAIVALRCSTAIGARLARPSIALRTE